MTETTAEFVAHLKSLDVQLSIRDDRLRCNAPEGVLTVELRQELAERKAELIRYLQPVQQSAAFPLSFAQQRLWFLYQLAPENPFYNVPAAIRLSGIVDQRALRKSFDAIVDRHAALRTSFMVIDEQPVQFVSPEVRYEFSIVNLPSDQEQIIQQLITTEVQRPFNLTTDPLLRVTLLQFEPTKAMLLLTMHHIVADGWSLGVLIRELAYFYSEFVQERSPELPSLPMQYSEFACWQRNLLQGKILEQLAYWREQLQDLPVLNLPSDRPRRSDQTYRGATYPLQFSPVLTQQLEALSQQSGASLFMALLAAFQTLLHRYTGQEDIAIGVPIANRHHSQVEELIGFFVNSLVMRSNLSGDPTFREVLAQVRKVALEAYEHQDLPFEKLVEALDPERDLSRNPLFQVAFALQNAPMQPLELPGLRLEPAPLEFGSTRFDLEIHLWEPNHGLRSLWQSEAGLSGFIAYSTDLFDRDRIGRLIEHFQTLLESIVANPDARLSQLALITASEHQLLQQWNQTSYRTQVRCFHQIFEAQAKYQIAVISEQGSFTYGDIDRQANQLAQRLMQLGVQTNSLVGLCVDRAIEMVIGILGILKAGGAYVPLDPNYPSDRLQFMLADTQVSIVLTQSWLMNTLPESQAKILCLDALPQSSANCELPATSSDQLAYVIYTSGSTGTPKGVLLTHRGLCNVVEAQQQTFHLDATSRILQFSSLSFDASVFEMALAFGSGATLYIPPKPAQLPGMSLLKFLEDSAITHALLTPAVLAVLPSIELPALQVLITGGEACSHQVVDRWAVDRRFFNAYGPTEATIWSTVAELRPGDHPLLIGHAIANTQVYLLDTHFNPAPIGIPGELYIGGEGLACGYLNRPELTAERFIQTKYGRVYKTGDRAVYRTDGSIEFLGRVDDQIKLRGFRVELGEIEATLQRHSAIRDAAIAVSNDRLIAYFSLELENLQSLSAQQIEHWQSLYNQTYQSSLNSQFNITGWHSSYTGESIAEAEMQEWISDRVNQILALKPKRILEIGCGTGLLLFQLAPHCERYVGTDFSTAALDLIQTDKLPQVELLHRTAIDFSDIDVAAFDVVILNSIVQYFPNIDYLMQVLEGAIERLAPGGVLFVGDVRNLALLKAFHAWMQFNRAETGMERTKLKQLIERSHFEEPELAIGPMFFYALQNRFPQLRQIQIRLSRGQSHNEMTQFRYNVLLHTSNHTSNTYPFHHWQLNPIDIEQIHQLLIETKPEALLITNITNSRVNDAIAVSTWINTRKSPKTVGQLREVLQGSNQCSIDPQALWNLETSVPYRVEITWSTDPGSYDALFVRRGVDAVLPVPQQLSSIWQNYANHPLQAEHARQLIPKLRQFLQQSLPDYMIPTAFVPLETLPLTVNGKIDRHSLPPVTEAPLEAHHTTTETEARLLEIWKDLLRLKNISVHDRFFELGGHSLLATQMTSRVRDTFGVELPLKSVFEAPTIAQLAPIIDGLHSTPTMPPIVRLDRAAYRQTRSSPTPSWSPLVSLTLGTNPQPFFCVHPMFGVVLPYLELATALKNNPSTRDRSFYGLQPLGLDGTPPLNRIEAIAAYYIEAIQTVQPKGAYLLGGWSFGGLVAFEMAQQLTRSGHQVELLAIIDTVAPGQKVSVAQSLKFLAGTAVWSMLPFVLDYLAIDQKFSRWQWSTIANLIPEAARLRLIDETAIAPLLRIVYANAQAAVRYVPQSYPHQLTLFKAKDTADRDRTLGWSQWSNIIEVHAVSGNHLSLLKSPHVQNLAELLSSCVSCHLTHKVDDHFSHSSESR